MPLPKNTVLTGTNSEYRIEKMLGQGGFGIVYAASDLQGKRVAIKEYFPSTLATRIDGSNQVKPNTTAKEATDLFHSQKRRFLQEAKHMESFKDDPHIVDVLDCFDANGTAYIVMEFIQGNTFAQVLENVPNHRLPLANALENLEPIVKVLEKMHKKNLIHRDISPYNIMFSAEKTILLDFGAARIVAPGGKFTLTAIINRPYSPPEQFQEIDAEKLQGTWSDVYALAATIYHAITGTLAPHANQREYNSYHYGKNILKPPSTFGIDITPQQENALLKGMALKIQDRYQTVREFFNALKGEKKCPKCGHEYTGDKCLYQLCPQIECPHCHRLYNSNEPKCPRSDCPSNQPEPPPIDKRPWIAAGCAILLAVAGFGYTNSAKNHLTEVTQEVKELKVEAGKYDYISNNFGYGTSAYYADTPVLVLEKDGASGNIPVYWSSWGKDNTTEQDANISSPDALKIIWDDAVTNQRRNAVITPSSESGAYIIHFSNKKDNDAFDVLVVVK